MSTYKDYEKILEFIYSNPDMPEDLRARCERWMLDREEDPELDSALQLLWETREMNAETPLPINPEAMSRLLSEIGENNVPQNRHRFSLKRALRYAAVAAALILTSLVTYIIADKESVKETVLLTAKGSTGEFQLPDGSKVLLNSDTRLTYLANNFGKDGKRRVSVDGEAYFEVSRDENCPFVVDMGEMDVEVLGTCFDVRNYSFSKTGEVVLLSGKVKVNTIDKKDESRILYPNQRFILDRKSGSCTVEDAAALNYCRWTSPRLKLENEPLGDILITLSRKYCLDLEVDSDVDKDFKLSLTLSTESLDEIMPVITFLSGINYTLSGNTLKVTQ